MNETLTTLSIYAAVLTIYGLVCGVIWKGLTITESVLSENRIARFGAWFYQPFPKDFDQRLARHFLPMFDNIFKVRRRIVKGLGVVGFPRIWRSVVVSLLTVGCFALVWLALLPDEVSLSFGISPTYLLLKHPDYTYRIVTEHLLYPFSINLICDYLSLAESRYVIRRIGVSKFRARAIMWLFADLVATYIIILFVFTLVNFPNDFFGFAEGQLDIFISVLDETALIGLYQTIDGISSIFNLMFSTDYSILYRNFDKPHWQWANLYMGIFVYSTFFTSIWVWLYFLSSYLLKLLHLFRPIKSFMKEELNATKRPFTSIAWMAVAIVSFLFWPSFIIYVVTA